jgi:hypothetical protein
MFSLSEVGASDIGGHHDSCVGPNVMIAVACLGAQRSSDGLKGLSVQSVAQKYRTYDISNAI